MEIKELLKPLPIDPKAIIALEYQYLLYQAIVAALQANLFAKLREEKSLGQLLEETGWQEKVLLYLLECLFYSGYLSKKEEKYCLSPLALAYLLEDNDLYMGNWFRDEFTQKSFSKKILACLNNEQTPREIPSWNPQMLKQVGTYFLTGTLRNTLNSCGFNGREKILDLGGGHGFYSIALAQQYPEVKVTVFDLPEVTPLTRENIAKFNLSERISVVSGNFLEDEIGKDYDIVLCFNIINGKENGGLILSRVWQALNPGGKVLLKCRVEDGEESLSSALDKLYWQVQGGKELFSRQSWLDILRQWGFEDNCLLKLDGIFAILQGTKK